MLVCPLDWGLGHASRMIPVINGMLKSGHLVTIGGCGKSAELLKTTFPDLPFIFLPSPEIRLSKNGFFFIIHFLLKIPFLLLSVFKEHRLLSKTVRDSGITMVISDNRYGLYTKNTFNVLVTHQLSPVLPVLFRWAEYPLYMLMKVLIRNFNECWIPDEPGDINYSGKLSHRFGLPENARFIGILSRFDKVSHESKTEYKYDMLFIMSGPQPQLSHFTKRIIKQANKLINQRILVISGLQDSDSYLVASHITLVDHLDCKEFQDAIMNSRQIICRSGYSTIMDLVTLNRKALLIPTPGQSEQKYLAEYLSQKKLFDAVKQSDFNLQMISLGQQPN